jgi:hypothetical protein
MASFSAGHVAGVETRPDPSKRSDANPIAI